MVVDTSAWVELIRGRPHPVAATLEALLERRADLAITEVIFMEVLAGCSAEALPRVRSRLLALPILQLEGLADHEEAARIYRRCRDAGQTVRSQLDCLIAVPAIRHGASLLHSDRDFETIARHSTLKLEPIDGPDLAAPDRLREAGGRYTRRRGARAATPARARGARRGGARPARRDPSRTTAR